MNYFRARLWREQSDMPHMTSPAGHLALGGNRQAQLVCAALEDIPHDPEVRLSRRAIDTTDGRAPRQPAGDIPHPQLAYLLDDDAQLLPHAAGSPGRPPEPCG
jgi:hypothetical protein